MRKLSALFIASALVLGAVNLVHAADTTATLADSKPIKGGYQKNILFSHHDMSFKGLNLTELQKQQIRDITHNQRDLLPRAPSIEDRRAMHDIITGDAFDRAKAEMHLNTQEEQRKVRMLAHLEVQNKIYNLLTQEQKNQFNASFEKRLTENPSLADKMPASVE